MQLPQNYRESRVIIGKSNKGSLLSYEKAMNPPFAQYGKLNLIETHSSLKLNLGNYNWNSKLNGPFI